MTIAELHGKLAEGRTSGYEYMEDLLTSDVFGTMRYAGWECGFLDWLLNAESAPIHPAPSPLATHLPQGEVVRVDFCFWPRLPEGREPDLALLLHFASGAALLMLLEVKYLSGMSDWDGPELDDEEGLTGDQIADQVWGLEKANPDQLLSWFESEEVPLVPFAELRKVHLLVTTHTALPSTCYVRSVRKRKRPWPMPCYWLSWTTLIECLEPYLDMTQGGQRALIDDLCRLLRKKGLDRFRGFERPSWQPPDVGFAFWSVSWWADTAWHPSCSSPAFWMK